MGVVSSFTEWANKLLTRVHRDLIHAIGTHAALMTTTVPDNHHRTMAAATTTSDDPATVENFLREVAHDNPVRFTPQQLAAITRGYSSPLGSGGFGDVYKGALPNGVAVAVKVLRSGDHGGPGRRSAAEQSFMAEVGNIGRTRHVNLVRLLGFCYHHHHAPTTTLRALVYEFVELGALDTFLLHHDYAGVEALRGIAVGVARGIRYLHEECGEQKIVHYDIKPGNVLLDGDLTPKVADFGLARLVGPDATHVTVSGPRGTPGFAAPEMWSRSEVTEKCDVYSFGMLLFEIVGRRRNFDEAVPESQRWFPEMAWNKYQEGKLVDLVLSSSSRRRRRSSNQSVVVAAVDEEEEEEVVRRGEIVERMCETAFWCVQQRPEARPPMSVVVKMLEGEMDIPPPVNPFPHLTALPAAAMAWTTTVVSGGDTATTTTKGLSERSDDLIRL
ncbi:hypothetical protein PR202_gb12219 [Eleusine coracana subsp. coracana]|uniref:Protein kinase domain-containing protein n=1 Tax=Eleusine coracana subsp. coracana TaxID=191504 RepID=A0AAV5EPU6_ELECO|nr:hypothetical protein PR202_gb12219 [Eleusine coracana subsp. coracana]